MVVTRALAMSVLVVAASVLAGCASNGPSGDARVEPNAEWATFEGEKVLRVRFDNVGDGTAGLGPVGTPMTVADGNGKDIPVFWGITPEEQLLKAGASETMTWYARGVGNASVGDADAWTFTLDPSFGEPRMPTPGTYRVCIKDRCSDAVLG